MDRCLQKFIRFNLFNDKAPAAPSAVAVAVAVVVAVALNRFAALVVVRRAAAAA